ncbi:hypothetical protein ACFQS1_02895 [Paractinoplanes rhizophilus]|uniref:Uncharacterized protein n=1 Tax=Paractinoplanes rhizophilus TaxID=1416877 RepID=A0ABW2HIT9_9ACTN
MIFDVYGFGEPDLGEQPDRLAEVLGVRWRLHESDYRGVYYAAAGPAPGGGKLRLQSNDLRDRNGEYHQLPDFPEYRYLLFVDKAERPDEIRSRIASLPHWRFLLRRRVD